MYLSANDERTKLKLITEAHITRSQLSEIRDSIDEALAEISVPLGSDFDGYEFLSDDGIFVLRYQPTESAVAHLTSLGIETDLS